MCMMMADTSTAEATKSCFYAGRGALAHLFACCVLVRGAITHLSHASSAQSNDPPPHAPQIVQDMSTPPLPHRTPPSTSVEDHNSASTEACCWSGKNTQKDGNSGSSGATASASLALEAARLHAGVLRRAGSVLVNAQVEPS